jgi:hypothetical protein
MNAEYVIICTEYLMQIQIYGCYSCLQTLFKNVIAQGAK